MSKDKVMLSVEVDRDLRKKFREVLAREDRTARDVMAEILTKWLDRKKV